MVADMKTRFLGVLAAFARYQACSLSLEPWGLLQGVTYQLTQGVTKNIIPTIPSTNAILAAVCTLEALKLIKLAPIGMNNYMM